MRGVDSATLTAALDKAQAEKPMDPAGIYVAPLGLDPIEVEGHEYSFYGARVLPGKAVKGHWHGTGAEPYAGFTAPGLMYFGWLAECGEVVWADHPSEVKREEEFTIWERVAHSFFNPGGTAIDFKFACPAAHLNDTDRFLAEIAPPYPVG